MNSYWRIDDVPLIAVESRKDIRPTYKTCREQGILKVRFLLTNSAKDVLRELMTPTPQPTKPSDYHICHPQPNDDNKLVWNSGKGLIVWENNKLYWNGLEACQKSFLSGSLQKQKSNKRALDVSTDANTPRKKHGARCECETGVVRDQIASWRRITAATGSPSSASTGSPSM